MTDNTEVVKKESGESDEYAIGEEEHEAAMLLRKMLLDESWHVIYPPLSDSKQMRLNDSFSKKA